MEKILNLGSFIIMKEYLEKTDTKVVLSGDNGVRTEKSG